MTTLTIDHVTIAGSDLARLRETFAGLGLATEYGGPHSNGVTHMDLLGFDDGSYIELISTLEPGPVVDNVEKVAFWGQHIAGDGGPCAWAVQVPDVAAEAHRVAALGVPVDGPHYYNRQRPDGTLVEWDLAFLGDKGAGAQLPFIIKDITPRERRVQPSASVSGGPLTGIKIVILGVAYLGLTISLFQMVYGWPPPQVDQDETLGIAWAYFEGTPVVLTSPLESGNWLDKRLDRFGDSPWAYLIGTKNLKAAQRHFDLPQRFKFFGRNAAWFAHDRVEDLWLGIIR